MVFPFHHRRANQREKPPSQRLPSGSARNRNGGRAGPTSLPWFANQRGGPGGERGQTEQGETNRRRPERVSRRVCFPASSHRNGGRAGHRNRSGDQQQRTSQGRKNRIERIHLRRNRPQLSQMGKFTPETDQPARANQRERGATRNKTPEAGADFGKYFQRPRPEAGEQGAGKVSERVHFPPSKHRAGGRSRHRTGAGISRASGPRERFEGERV